MEYFYLNFFKLVFIVVAYFIGKKIINLLQYFIFIKIMMMALIANKTTHKSMVIVILIKKMHKSMANITNKRMLESKGTNFVMISALQSMVNITTLVEIMNKML